jgi:hypothetical protein
LSVNGPPFSAYFKPGVAGTGHAQPDWPPKVTGLAEGETGLRQQTDHFLPSALRLKEGFHSSGEQSFAPTESPKILIP